MFNVMHLFTKAYSLSLETTNKPDSYSESDSDSESDVENSVVMTTAPLSLGLGSQGYRCARRPPGLTVRLRS